MIKRPGNLFFCPHTISYMIIMIYRHDGNALSAELPFEHVHTRSYCLPVIKNAEKSNISCFFYIRYLVLNSLGASPYPFS